MAQELAHIDSGRRSGGAAAGRMNSRFSRRVEPEKSHTQLESAAVYGLQSSNSILSAFGDESSRRILTSAIVCGKTVEDVSAEQHLPRSTCYRQIRRLVGEGLMILERTVVTQTGKKYATYRTSFSDVTITLKGGEIAVETMPNLEVLDKLRRIWLSTNYPPHDQGDGFSKKNGAWLGLGEKASVPFR